MADFIVADWNHLFRECDRRRKAVRDLQRAHAHVRNQRLDFRHKVSRQLVNEYGAIAVEDLNGKGLAAGMLAKAVHERMVDVRSDAFVQRQNAPGES